MATSFNTYLPRLQDKDTTLHLRETGEVVSLKINHEIFDANGQLKGQARFSADKDNELFAVTWPRMDARCMSVLSQWRLVIKNATDDRVSNFNKDTAEELGSNNWEDLKKVIASCRTKFKARLLSMSSREIIFAHGDEHSAEKMKESNEMVDVMNTLLADVERKYCDILVDWDVTIRPVTVLSEGFEDEEQENINSILLTDADSPSLSNSTMSRASSTKEVPELPPHFQRMLEVLTAEHRKTQTALDRMTKENAKRHRIICQKIEELKSSLQHLHAGAGDGWLEDRNGMSESDQNCLTDSALAENPEGEDSIPSAKLFEEPEISPRSSSQQKKDSSGYQSYQNNSSSEKAAPGFTHETRPKGSGQQYQPYSSSEKSTTRVLHREDSSKPSETFRDELSGSDRENRNLDAAVERAYRHDDVPPPKAKSYHTILCLDISTSMIENGGFAEMKDVVEQFINGVEDIVNDSGVEENIGVVTFGGTSDVIQNLTNDYSRVRDAIDNIVPGGKSPFVQALLVSMAAFVEKGSIISVSRVYDVRPRIIFISDGLPTENLEDDGLDVPNNKMHVRTGLTRLMMNFSTKDRYTKVGPVVYIPVGRDPDRDLLKSMATLSRGEYMEPKDLSKLCSYFLLQETIGKTLACMKGAEPGEHSSEQIKALATSLMPAMSEEEKQAVVDKVEKELASPSKIRKSRLSNFDDVFEDTVRVDAGELLPLGTRVKRGPDWRWENQDGEGPGTVFSHSDKAGWTHVEWDVTGTHNRYAYGPDLGYHIWKTDEPRLMGDDGDLHIGMTVEKGPDWNYIKDSLQAVQTGIVIRKSRFQRKLMVRWDNTELQVVRWGAEDKYDVMYCDPSKIPKEAPLEFVSSSAEAVYFQQDFPAQHRAPPQANSAAAPEPADFEHGLWQWKGDDGSWNDYLPEVNANIEKNFKRSKKKNGSCVINRDGINRRVMFGRMTEKVIDSGVECAVQRVPHPG